MFISYKNLRFIDSLSFLEMPLSKFKETFDLDEDSTKLMYPIYFNTVANETYEGEISPKEIYGYDNFTEAKKAEFDIFYEREKTKLFVNSEQLLDYCIRDVNILKKGVLLFMKSFVDIMQVNPILQAITIASACMLSFRRNYLKPNTLGIVPSNQYAGNKRQSEIGRKWLELKNREYGRKLVLNINCRSWVFMWMGI